MPTISIKDEQGDEIISTDLSAKGLGRYVRTAASLRAVAPLGRLMSTPLHEARGERALALALEKELPVGKNSELSVAVGASLALGVHPSGDSLFGGSDLQADVTVPNGTAYTSLTLEALLKAGLASQQGNLAFGFNVGTALRYAYFHPFDIVAGSPTVRDAIAGLLSSAVFPADADDLAKLPVGAYVSLAGEGELSFSGGAALSSTTTLLATPGLPLIGSVGVTGGASVSVHAEWQASGAFELRTSRPSTSQLRLGFYRRRGRSLSVSAKAMAGVTATFKDSDLIATLMRAISSDPEADLLALVNAGLDDDQIEAIQRAVAASIDRSLTLAAQLELSLLREDEALVAYEIDLERLDTRGRAAVDQALRGKLGSLDRVGEEDGAPVRLTASAATRLRERSASWRINLLGILNVASFSELVRQGSVTYDPVGGALTAADHVMARRIRSKALPFAADPEKLRKVLFESLMVTAAYQASRALGSKVSLTADHTYLEQRGKTKRSDLEDHYRALVALGLCDEGERDARLGAVTDVGSSTFVIENRFDASACDAMFLDAEGEPHPAAHYERIARSAFLSLIPGNDPARSYRRIALDSDITWKRLRELGAALGDALPAHVRHDPLRLAVVRGDVFTIAWWARAMHKAGVELVSMRQFLGQRDADALAGDRRFLAAREKLEQALASVVASTEARFDDPWDVLAVDAAAARLGRLESVIVSTRFAARYTESAALPSAPVAAAPASRAARGAGVRAGRETRAWTAEELEVFSRHVVNLRGGTLSGDGSFSSTRGQVTRIFEEHVPAYVQEQAARGERPRVLFFAHGGLVEEEEGLRPVLARRRFWALNGIYPVYFVWETGLRETLHDILGGVVPRSRDVRGEISDLAIERLARGGGKPIWGQMKHSAEKASAPGGGARLVAELAASLWKKVDGELELHALGHSAGSIFHAYFLPALLGAPRRSGSTQPSIRTLHLLAPAITTALFKEHLLSLVGSGKPITELAMYTMADEFERADTSMRPYGKSLLYLVSRSFEDAVPTPLLGLQESLKRDLPLIRFFGLAGTEKVAGVAFSVTDASTGLRDRSGSVTHGGFDNDVATMTSVVRRVLDVPDTASVVDYFEDPVEGVERRAVPAAALAAAAAAARSAPSVRRAPARKKWTVMVWMAGDNDLEDFGDGDLREMKRVGSTDAVDVVVQFDSMRDDRTRRYHLRPGTRLDQDVVEQLGETNTGDPAVATDFFSWAIGRHPSERVLAVIWNHGSGIDETDVYRSARARGVPPRERQVERRLVRTAMSTRYRRAIFSTTIGRAVKERAIAYDDTARDFLDNIELKRVLTDVKKATGRRIDVLGFDACLMNMLEIAYQLRGTADVIVGSEEIEPGDGWPYDRVLARLNDHPEMPGRRIGPEIVAQYLASCRGGTLTQSALDLGRLDAVTDAVDRLGTALLKGMRIAAEYAAITKALNATQRFDTADFVDLGHFCEQLASRSKNARVASAARAVRRALSASPGFVLATGTRGSAVKNASGVAIYFPARKPNVVYRKLDFAKAASWSRFLEAYHEA